MKELTIVRAIQTCAVQWDVWDEDGNYWYLRFRNGHGSISKNYDVDNAVRTFRVDEVSVTLEEMCEHLGIRLELDPEFPQNSDVLNTTRKITINAPRPGNIKLIIADEDKWSSVEVENWKTSFAVVMQALTDLENMCPMTKIEKAE